MVNDNPLAMEEPLPSLSSVLSPPEIEKGTIEIEELPPPPPPTERKHHQEKPTTTIVSSMNRRAWMPSRPRQIPHQHRQANAIINVKEQDEQPLHPNNRRMRRVALHKEIMHHLPKEQDGTTSVDNVAHHQQQHPHEQATATSIPNDDSTSTSTSTSQPIINNYNNNNLGSKPKLSNMSLLSSAVAYATLERCLLGRNEGEDNTNDEDDDDNEVDVAAQGLQSHPNANNFTSTSSVSVSSSVSSLLSLPPPNYSKQCKAGHIIDILELRRLSSRGVPDEPPEIRVAAHHHHHDDGENVVDGPHSITTSMGLLLSHRSYRPLVWRVLLGYLPPQTSLWNMVLDRDRQLYDMLVQELFSTTCPGPHEYYTTMREEEEEVDEALFCHGEGREKNQVHDAAASADTTASTAVMGIRNVSQKNAMENGSDFVIGEDDDYDDDDKEENDVVANNANIASPPRTPIESPDEAATTSTATITTTTATTNTPLATTPHTPGLLSARMQLEWIRGEKNGGENSVFGGQNHHHHHPYSSSPSTMTRTSPMCSMNTPRTRIYETRMKASDEGVAVADSKEYDDDAPRTISQDIASELADIEHSSSSSILLEKSSSGNIVEGVLSHRLKESLLLPDEDEEEGGNEVVMETINVNSATDEDATPDLRKKTPSKSEDSWGMKNFLQGNKNSSFDSADDDDDAGAILPTTTPTTRRSLVSSPSPENDEEENMLLLDEIRKDVIRTHPDLRFFLEPEEGLGQKRYAALERILFVWAKLNKGVRYVQGMNEIVGTLYFVLAHDSNEEWSNHAEADTYFLFNALMVEMRDVFVPALDEADTGIHGRINNMITLLSLHDPEIRCHLDSVGIDPSFYSVRWLTTLLSREFLLPDTIRLWDSMFASTHKDNFLRYVSVTMVMVIREELLSGDFSTCMRLLQAYPPTNLDRLLESSRALWIYESQITLACHKGGISLGHALRSIAPPPAIVMAYGLPGGVAPPIRQQVRQVGERGFAAARGAANGASTTVVSAGRNLLGNAMSFWRDSKSSMGDGI